jgi:hypothetical protein
VTLCESPRGYYARPAPRTLSDVDHQPHRTHPGRPALGMVDDLDSTEGALFRVCGVTTEVQGEGAHGVPF